MMNIRLRKRDDGGSGWIGVSWPGSIRAESGELPFFIIVCLALFESLLPKPCR